VADKFVHETVRTAVYMGALGLDEKIILELIRRILHPVVAMFLENTERIFGYRTSR
jgi:hypothetical protein